MTENTTRTTTNAMAIIASPSAPGATPTARGKVIHSADGTIVFAPAGTNYELHLAAPGYAGPVGALTEGVIRVTARKVWTVASGGNFIAPVFGPPKTIQGRVRAMNERSIVVHAGAPIVVDLPDEPALIDLPDGPIRVGAMVNVTARLGAMFEPTSRT